MPTLFTLMLLTPTLGWIIAPTVGNPYSEMVCNAVVSVIEERNIHYLDDQYFSEAKCQPPLNDDPPNQ